MNDFVDYDIENDDGSNENVAFDFTVSNVT